MKHVSFACCLLLTALLFHSCGTFNKALQSSDHEYKYEVAKQLYAEGKYTKATALVQDVIAVMKGTDQGEESLFLLGMSAYRGGDYEASASFFRKYYQSYPRGTYAEDARFHVGMSLYYSTSEPKLDQSETVAAMTEMQNFIELYPSSSRRDEAQDVIFKLQDKLIEKEYLAAKMYYDMGDYFGNCSFGGSNYAACIITAENALRDYPFASKREEFSMMILRAKYGLARQSVEQKREERLASAVDEYYGFMSEFPESKYGKEAKAIFEKASRDLRKVRPEKQKEP